MVQLLYYISLLALLAGPALAAKPPKLSLNTQVPPAHDGPPSGPWPHTWTDGVQRNKPGSESPIQLPGSPIGPSQNYNPVHVGGTQRPPNTPSHVKRALARRAALEAYDEIMARYAEPEAYYTEGLYERELYGGWDY